MPDNLPAVPDDAAVEEMVFDGEVVEEDRAPGLRTPPVPARAIAVRPRARAVARHAAYVPAGAVVLYRRRRTGRTVAQRMAHQFAIQGEADKALLMLKHDADERHRRHERLRGRAETIVMLAKNIHWLLLGAVVLMLLLGMALGNAAWAFTTFAALVRDARLLVRAAFVAVPVVVVTALYAAGRRGADLAPGWLRTAADDDADVAIDEKAITQALRQLRIPQISDYLKAGVPMAYIVPCRADGRGTYCEVRLPNGLPALEIAKQARRERLAASLYRHTKEVWPTTGADNSHLKLWIADKGALEEGAGPYPLLAEGFTDVFKGAPFGKTLRGDPVTAPLMERNTITGGMPGQGKSSAARVIMCGAALDPTAELWIMIPDINFDFEVMKRRCSRYAMGAKDEHVATIRDWLLDLRDDVQARGQLLVDYEVPAVTRKLASARIGLHPLFVLLEEAHVAIQHGIYGKEIAGLLVDIVKLGRKRGIHVIVSTQAPTKDSMPRDVTRNCSNGIAFAVGDHVPNDALLGAGAYRAGHRATELIPGTDRGVAVVKGFSGERSEMVQVYFLDVERGHDQVTPIIDRAMAEVARRGGLPGGPPPALALEVRDLIDDLDAVIDGPDRVRLAELPGRLRKLAPSWLPYRGLDGVQLAQLLDREDVAWVKPRNVPQLDPAELVRIIQRREVS